jgi:hypothetical protein
MIGKQQMRNALFGRTPKDQPVGPSHSAFVCCPAFVVLPSTMPFAQAVYEWAYKNAVIQTEPPSPLLSPFDPNWN